MAYIELAALQHCCRKKDKSQTIIMYDKNTMEKILKFIQPSTQTEYKLHAAQSPGEI